MVATRADYASILRTNTPILDVRAPIEYAKGALPNSTNIPVLTDEERHHVGIEYKQHGNQAAVDLGFKLVDDSARAERLKAWRNYLDAHSDALITCWRGGQRSQIAQQWLEDAGYAVPRIAGGFKAMRQCSLDVLTQAGKRSWVVVAGKTGVGKTIVLNQYQASIDLEGLANHFGSSFGRKSTPQPTPVTFEIALAQKLLQTEVHVTCLIEDESRTIGRLGVPSDLYEAMQTAPVVVLESDLEQRLAVTFENYVENANPAHLRTALARIKKRLGGDRFRIVATQLDDALSSHEQARHYAWINSLFEWYYDPMYEYQLEQKQDRIVFRGCESEVVEFLTQNYQIQPL